MFFKATLYPNLAWSLGSFIELRITPKPRKERTSKKKGQRNRSLMDICLLTKKDIVEDGKCCLAWVEYVEIESHKPGDRVEVCNSFRHQWI